MNEAYSFSSSGFINLFVLLCVRTFALLHYTTDFSLNLAPTLRHESATRSRTFRFHTTANNTKAHLLLRWQQHRVSSLKTRYMTNLSHRPWKTWATSVEIIPLYCRMAVARNLLSFSLDGNNLQNTVTTYVKARMDIDHKYSPNFCIKRCLWVNNC
jgi:hypothetical protein